MTRRRNKRNFTPKYRFGLRDMVIIGLVILIAGYLSFEKNNQPPPTSHTPEKTWTPSSAPARNIIEGHARVSDGDTIRIRNERIRIVGIDAPELAQYCTRDEKRFACGEMSKDYMIALIGNRPVQCKWIERDKYKRILGLCRAGDTDLNRRMVEDGWAFSYWSYPDEERYARQNKIGMWKWKVQQPAKWRRAHTRH